VGLDVVLLGFLVVGFGVGFFRGVIRSVSAIGAFVVAFIFAVYLRTALGDWLARSATFTPFYADLVAFAVIFFALFVTLLLFIMLSRAPTEWSRHRLLDDVLGGAVGMLVVAFSVAAVMVMLDSYYAVVAPPTAVDLGWPAELHRSLGTSSVAGVIRSDFSAVIGFVLGPILPPEIRAVIV